MPYKDPEKAREAKRLWAERNRAKVANTRRDRRSRLRKFVDEYKLANSTCADCQMSYPPHILDFDHLRDKEFGIGDRSALDRNLDDIKREIEKCDIVCSNCHRHRTWLRAQGL